MAYISALTYCLMEIFLLIFTPIATGLAFITYRHPSTARQIINTLLLIMSIIYIIILTYYRGKRDAYSKSSSIILKAKPLKDTSNVAPYNIILYTYQSDLKESINNQVNAESKTDGDKSDSIFMYYGITMGVLFVFFMFVLHVC